MKRTKYVRCLSWLLVLAMALMLAPVVPMGGYAAEETGSQTGAEPELPQDTGDNTGDGPVIVPREQTLPANVHVLDASADLTAFAQGDKADGDTETVGGYFTVIYSAKNKVDASAKTFDDGYEATQRLNFGGKTDPAKNMMNSVKFTTQQPATVKIWWVSGGDGREMAIYDASGTVVTDTDAAASAKNGMYISTLNLEAAGTYYLGVPTGSNYLFKVQVTEELPPQPKDHVLDASTDLTAFAQGDKADGDTETVGGYFTVIYSAKNKVDASAKTFDDGYEATQRLNFGGKTDPAKNMINSVKFTTQQPATVKIWWVSGGDGREMAIYDASGAVVMDTGAAGSVKNGMYISVLNLEAAGTYYLGVPTGSNYLFKLQVTENGGSAPKPPRAAWADVAAPAFGAITDGGDGKLTVNVTANVGYDGGDAVAVTMLDAQENEIASKRSIAEKREHTLTFEPAASGTYTFRAVLTRDGEEEGKSSAEDGSAAFKLPLKAPAISSATSTGGGKISVVWDAVAEADSYEIHCDGELVDTTKALSYEVTGLEVGKSYAFTVVALRDSDRSAASAAVSATATESAQTVWSFSRYGTGVDDKNNGYQGDLNSDGHVTVYSEGGKGKIVPNSTDGLSFYYTAIPAEYNFTLRAKVTVDSWTLSNGQEGFGLMAADRVGENGNNTPFWNNQYMAIASKIEYTTDSGKYSMKLGLGTLVKTGVTPELLPLLNANDTAAIAKFSSVTGTLDHTPETLGKGPGSYNIIGKFTKDPGNTIDEQTAFILEVQRNNTGYFVSYYDAAGNLVAQRKDYDPQALTMVDKDAVYVGFFASRNARATFSDVTLTTILASEDAPAEGRPVTKITPTITLTSASSANSASYNLGVYANVAGSVAVKLDGKTVAEKIAVTGGERKDIPVTLTQVGANKIEAVFTPDPDQDLGAYTELSSTDPVTASITVDYQTKWAEQYNLYVAPGGKSTAQGTREDPLDIYTAIRHVRPGQTIVLLGDTYAITSPIRIEQGNDGTQEQPIRMIADPVTKNRPVFDMQDKVTGITHGGDWWYFQGFDVTRSANGQKGFQLSGHHNVLSDIVTHHNGNTGLQLSRYASTDPKSEWPSYNLILNCTSHNNADAGYEDADGFAAKLTCGPGNVFDGCVAYQNADDGWDLYAKVETGPIGAVTIRNCVAYQNGYILRDGQLINAGNGNGFKMGGESLSGHHKLINSYAFFNKAKGIDSNSCPDISVENSTSYNNESFNVAFYTNNAANTDFAATGIVSFKDATGASGLDVGENLKPKGTQDTSKYLGDSNYYWDGAASKNTSGQEITADSFVSLTFQGVDRNADGTINLHGFLQLKEKSDAQKPGSGAAPGGTASEQPVVKPEEEKPTDPTTEPTTEPTTKPTKPTKPSTTPGTGDTTPIAQYVAIMALSLLGLAAVLLGSRKRRA